MLAAMTIVVNQGHDCSLVFIRCRLQVRTYYQEGFIMFQPSSIEELHAAIDGLPEFITEKENYERYAATTLFFDQLEELMGEPAMSFSEAYAASYNELHNTTLFPELAEVIDQWGVIGELQGITPNLDD